MSKDKLIFERSAHTATSGMSEGDAPEQFDTASVAHYLASIGHDLEVSPRDPDETARQFAERLQSAVQDMRFALNDELDQLERDLENVIDYLDEGGAA